MKGDNKEFMHFAECGYYGEEFGRWCCAEDCAARERCSARLVEEEIFSEKRSVPFRIMQIECADVYVQAFGNSLHRVTCRLRLFRSTFDCFNISLMLNQQLNKFCSSNLSSFL
jgi:hypothetical protein